MRYRVRHLTEYSYDLPVSTSYGLAHLLPRDFPGQRVEAAELDLDPRAEDRSEHLDHFGNRTVWFAVRRPHRSLSVTASSTVLVEDRGRVADLIGDLRWEQARVDGDGDGDDPIDVQYRLDSPLASTIPAVVEYTRPFFEDGRPLLDAVTDLCGRINDDFEFRPGATDVNTNLHEVMDRRVGVCQDYAHVAVACLRSLGLVARYFSGYLETAPPPGRPRLQGADVSHAWAGVLAPGHGWLELDPTNAQLVDDRYVTIGWGRDYGDVAPLSGVIYSDAATSRLRVSVDVIRDEEVGDREVNPAG